MKQYSLLIQWSVEDNCYLATCPEFKHIVNMGGPVAHGDTWEEAGREGAIAIQGIIDTLEEDYIGLPDPQLFTFKEDNGRTSS